MPFAAAGAGLGAVGSIVGGGKQADATKKAAADQLQAATQQTNLERDQFNTVQNNEAPFLAAGKSAVGTLQSDLPALTQTFDPTKQGIPAQFSFDPSQVANDPAYQFALQQGTQALQRSAAARGGALGGAAAKSLTQFAQGNASQFENQDYNQALETYGTNYSDAFNTFQANQNNVFNKLAGVAQIGQGGNAQVNQAGQAATAGMSAAAGAAGNASAAGAIGTANAQASEFGGISASLQSLLKNSNFQNLFKGGSSYSPSPSSGGADDGYFGG